MTTSVRADKIGYARVSTAGQKLDAQVDALTQVGCLKIFTDQVSGSRAARPGWEQLRAYWRPGVVWLYSTGHTETRTSCSRRGVVDESTPDEKVPRRI